jgi:dehydrogenase/reductase SDR family member 4
MMNLEGKVAIITGASKGIGEACAYSMGKAGATVVICSRNEASLQKVAQQFDNEGIKITYFTANTGNEAELRALCDFTVHKFGTIDIVVNNAATNPVFGPIEDTPMSAFDKIMEVNVKGPMILSNLALPYMKEKGGGSIINISSVEGHSPSEGLGVYGVSKAALIQLTKSMAMEWGKYNIRVNAICPGLIQTKFSEALWKNEAILKTALRRIPMNRVGQSEEIANLVAFLASDAASYCTGSVVAADGGYLL